MKTINSSFNLRWTISKARDTYNYDICSLWQNNKKITSCMGGGYDLAGTCLGNFLTLNYTSRLKKLYTPDFYGLTFINTHTDTKLKKYKPGCDIEIILDGACGWSSMEEVARAIKLIITLTSNSPKLQVYSVEDNYGK